MARDYSGFKAVVEAIDTLREKVEIENNKQLTVTRALREDQRLQLPLLRSVAQSLRARGAGIRNNLTAVPDRVEFSNLKLQTNSITLSAKSVVLETNGKGGDRRESQDNERLAKSIGKELKNIKLKSDTGLKLIFAGIFTGIGFQIGGEIARGFEKSFGQKTGFTSRKAGQAVGDVAAFPVEKIQSLKFPEKLKESADYFVAKIKSIRYGIGEALASAIEQDGDFSTKAQTFGEILQTEGKKFSNQINDDLNDSAENFIKSLQEIPSLLTSPLDSWLRSFRQEALKDIGVNLVKERAAVISKENKRRSSVRAIDDKTEELIIAVGGYAGARGLSGQRIPKILLEQTEDNVAAIAVNNPSTDIPGEVLSDREKRWKATLGSVARPNIRGYSPDAIEMAAQAMAALQKNPEIKIRLVGESGGGFVAEEATALLNLLGYKDRVVGVGIGTPDLIGGLEQENYRKIISPDEPLGHVAEELQKFGLAKKTEDQQIKGATQHPIEGYINLPEIRKNLFGDSETTAGESRKVLEFVEFNTKAAEKANTEGGKKYYKGQFEANLKEVQDRIQKATGKTVLKNLKQAEILLQSALQKLEAPAASEPKDLKILDKYILYLDQLVEQAKKEASERIKILVPNYSDLTIPEKKVFAGNFSKDIDKDIKKFRMAVEDSENEIAVEIGERILETIQPIRKIYQELLEILPPDLSGTQSIRAQIGKLTKIQNEVLKGQPKVKGNSPIGLTQIVGNETAEGFVAGIEEKLGDVNASGEQLGEEAIKGAKERLDIASPSKVFEKLGIQTGEGFEQGAKKSLTKASATIKKEIEDFIYAIGNRLKMVDSDSSGLNQKDLIETWFLGVTPFNDSDRIVESVQLESQRLSRGGKKKNVTGFDESIKAIQARLKTLHSNISRFEELIVLNEVYIRAWERVSRGIKNTKMPVIDSSEMELKSTRAFYKPSNHTVKFDKSIIKNIGSQVFLGEDLSTILHELRHSIQDEIEDRLANVEQVLNSKISKKRKQRILEGAKSSNNSALSQWENVFQSPYPESRKQKNYQREIDAYFYDTKNFFSFRSRIEKEFRNIGTAAVEGFTSGVNSQKEVAIDVIATVIDDVVETTEDILGIQSPSKVFEQIGAFVVEGFNKGVEKVKQVEFLNNFATNAQQQIDSTKEVINQGLDQVVDAYENKFTTVDNFLANTFNNIYDGFNQLVEGLFEQFPALKQLVDIFLGLGAGFLVGQALEGLVGWLSGVADATFDAVLQAESLELAFTSLSGGAEQGAKGLAFVRQEAQRLGLELKTAEEAYAGFTAVTRFTPLQGFQADKIFSSFAETAALRGFSSEEQSRMFAAINQMISKRKLSAEEVRGQLGEISGLAFESTLARALGLNAAQMNEQMSEGLLIVEDVLPKVAAQYAAQNSAIATGNETLAQSLNRLNNAVVTLQRSFASWIEKFKIAFNVATAVVENLIPAIELFIKALSNAGLTIFLDTLESLIKYGLKSNAVLSVFVNFLKAVASLIQYAIPHLVEFAGKFILVSLAVDSLWNAWKIFQNNPFPGLSKSIEDATANVRALEQALNKTAAATQSVSLPKYEDLKVKEGWNLFGIDTGINLEGLRAMTARQIYNPRTGKTETYGGTTLAQSNLGRFQEQVADRLAKADQTLFQQPEVEKTLKNIQELDKELTKARSRRFQIPAGDRTAYEESVAAEQKLLEQRDEYLKTTAQFQQNLEADKNAITEAIKLLDGLVARREITADAEKSLRASLEARLKDVETTSRTFEDLASTLAKQVNALSIALRNLNENATFFNENLERTATNARVQFIRRAREAGLGSQIADAGIEQIETQTLDTRLGFLRDQLGAVNEYLSKPDFADLLEELRQQAEDAGINLENTATIDRLIGENRSQQETAVLNALKEQLRLKTEIGQTEENLEQSIRQMGSNLRDLSSSVEDFFFNLNQQIQEALVEVDRLLNKLKYADIKGKLQRALVPGSDTFVNGLVSQIQGIFDQASGIVEQLLGQRSARINFVGERRGLQFELENFTRNLGGATEALELFRQGLVGSGQVQAPSNNILPVPKAPASGQGKLPPPPPAMGLRQNIGNLTDARSFAPLFDLLFKGEGNENSVNRGVAGDTPGGLRALFGRDAAQFTVGEILNLQKQRRIFAVGMPQFIPSTLRDAVKNSGISLDTPFNLQTQQKLAIELFKNKRPEIWKYLSGKSNNLIEAAQGMAREWAAIGLSYPEAGRGVGVSRYAGTAGNAASISPQQVQQALIQTRQNLTGTNGGNLETASAQLPNVNNEQATNLTNTLIGIKNRQINLGDATVRQEIENFILNLNQTKETILQQMGDTIRQSRQSVVDAQNSLIDARSQFSPQTQTSQLESELRGVENQFRGLDTQLFEQERGLQDNITGLDKLLSEIQPIIELLQSSGNAVDQESAKFLQGLIGKIESDRTSYQGMLTEIQGLRGELKQGKIDAENFVQAQAKLRRIQADLERIGTELTIAQQQNNLEQERAIALLQSRQQLEADILQISNDFADNETERTRRLELAREQARLQEKEIEYQFQSKTLTREIELINQRLAIAQNLTNLGITNELQIRQSQKQLEQEILEIKQQYPDLAEQELRIELAKQSALQRERQIENEYRNQRLQREQEILDIENQIAERLAEQLEARGDNFAAASLREQAAFAAELLRYEQEIEAIRQRYPDDQQRADELIRKATTLRDLNLSAIDRQFQDLGETLRGLATDSFATFLTDVLTGSKSIGDAFADMAKNILASIAQIAARMAISGLFNWLNIGFAEGGTVPNFAEGGEVRKNLPILDSIQSALQSEGPRGVLAVFTPGEEILSLRTGEAQRYQSLKAKFGKDPLKQFAGNFAFGGSVSDRLLDNLAPTPSVTLPISAQFDLTNSKATPPMANNKTVVVNVTTPDVAGFKKSERQIAREVYEYMQRA
jgi:tape measure domain-containing protein